MWASLFPEKDLHVFIQLLLVVSLLSSFPLLPSQLK